MTFSYTATDTSARALRLRASTLLALSVLDRLTLTSLAPRRRRPGGLADAINYTMERGGNRTRCTVTSLTRAERARLSYKPSTLAKQVHAESNELLVVRALGGTSTGDNEAMDVIAEIGSRRVGVEVKTFVSNSNDKVTMHPPSRVRKEKWAKSQRACGFTVLIDDRDKFSSRRQWSGHRYYVTEGFGAFRLHTMTPIKSLAELRAWIAKRCK